MRGWSREPAVRGILDVLSRMQGVGLEATERHPETRACGEVRVGDAGVGWVTFDHDGGPSGGDELLGQAASVLSAHVALLNDVESLSGEVAHTYEELNLLYSLSESLGNLHDEKAICALALELARRVLRGRRGVIVLSGAEGDAPRIVAHSDPAGGDRPADDPAIGSGMAGWVLQTGRSLLADDFSCLPAEIPRGAGGRPSDAALLPPPLMYVPMTSRGRNIGAIGLCDRESGGSFTAQDLKLAMALASTAAVFIDVMRFTEQVREGERLRSELEIARTIQQGLLPRREPVIPGVDVAGLCRPASDVGGDYYGFMEDAVPGMTGLAVMDVSGHSVGAAVCMASTRSILRCEAWSRRSTREVVERVNDLVCLDLEEGGMYATFFYALYDHKTGELRYTNAGHPAPLLLKAGEQRCRRLTMGGMGVGISARQPYREETLRMTAGDVLLLYTDGLTEARNAASEMFGESKLAAAVGRHRKSTAAEMISFLLGEVNAFVGDAPQADDIALVVLKAVSTNPLGLGVS